MTPATSEEISGLQAPIASFFALRPVDLLKVLVAVIACVRKVDVFHDARA